MGFPEWVARRAWVVILSWILLAALAAPLASKLSEVMVTEESGFLPPTAESVKALEAVGRGGGGGEPDAIIVVSGVEVGPDLYWSIVDDWRSIDWRGARVVSWVDVAYTVYSKAYKDYLEGIEGGLKALQGFRGLWLGVLNASNQLASLAGLVNNTASLMAGADEAYSGYYKALRGLAAAAPQVRTALYGGLTLCNNVSKAYAGVLFDVVRAEYLLETLTNAYDTGVLTPGEVAEVVEASNLSNLGIPPLNPALVYAVFNYTQSIGGPGAFDNRQAAAAAAWVMSQSPALTGEAKAYLSILANVTGALLQGVGDLRGLAAQGPEGLARLYEVVDSTVSKARLEAIKAYGAAVAEASGAPLVAIAYRGLAGANCTPASLDSVLEASFREFLKSQGIPEGAASRLASAAARGLAPRALAASAALETVASAAARQGAPGFLVEALTSPVAVEALLDLDPSAAGVVAADRHLALEAAVRVLEPLSLEWGFGPGILRELAAGADARELALELAYEKAPDEARPLLDYFKRNGVPESEEDFLYAARAVLVNMTVDRGVPRDVAEAVVDAAVKAYKGSSSPEEEASKLAAEALSKAWPSIMEELEGSLVSRNRRAFLILLFNTSYDDALRVRDEVKRLLDSKGYKVDVKATGNVVISEEVREAAVRDVERSDRYSSILVFIVLALVLESVVAVFLPFTGIGLGLAVALGIAYLLARADALTVTTISRTIMFSTGLGLGIDYATLISRRFREEMAELDDKREAAAAALRASARPVIAGAATAAIGFGSLALAWDFPFLKSIGTSVPIAVALVAAASLTFIPALLSLVGGSRVLWWPGKPYSEGVGGGPRALGSVAVRGAPVLLALVLLALIPAVQVHAGFRGSHDLTLMMPEGTEALEGIRLVSEEFEPGVVYPLYIVPSKPEAAGELADAVSSLGCIARVSVENSTGTVYVAAVMSVNPLSADGVECARQAREAAHRVDPGSLVGGMAAVSLDLEEMLNERFYHRVLPAAVVLMFASMLAAYGGVAVALAAVAVVAIAAELAIAAAVYYFESIEGSQVPWFLPITVFTAILGVGMDYNSFSISRAAEECLADCSREAVARAFSKAALLVMGLALIMAGAYGGLLLSRIPNLRMMGAALSLGVIFAGVLAGVALTPALISILGRRAWWPWGPKAETG